MTSNNTWDVYPDSHWDEIAMTRQFPSSSGVPGELVAMCLPMLRPGRAGRGEAEGFLQARAGQHTASASDIAQAQALMKGYGFEPDTAAVERWFPDAKTMLNRWAGLDSKPLPATNIEHHDDYASVMADADEDIVSDEG